MRKCQGCVSVKRDLNMWQQRPMNISMDMSVPECSQAPRAGSLPAAEQEINGHSIEVAVEVCFLPRHRPLAPLVARGERSHVFLPAHARHCASCTQCSCMLSLGARPGLGLLRQAHLELLQDTAVNEALGVGDGVLQEGCALSEHEDRP